MTSAWLLLYDIKISSKSGLPGWGVKDGLGSGFRVGRIENYGNDIG